MSAHESPKARPDPVAQNCTTHTLAHCLSCYQNWTGIYAPSHACTHAKHAAHTTVLYTNTVTVFQPPKPPPPKKDPHP